MGQCKVVRLSVRLKMSKKIHIKTRPTGTNKNVIPVYVNVQSLISSKTGPISRT